MNAFTIKAFDTDNKLIGDLVFDQEYEFFGGHRVTVIYNSMARDYEIANVVSKLSKENQLDLYLVLRPLDCYDPEYEGKTYYTAYKYN